MASQRLCITEIAEPPETNLTIKQAPNFEAEDSQSSDDVEMTEQRMRRALGIGGPSAQPILATKATSPRHGASGSVVSGSPQRKPDSTGGSSTSTGTPSLLQQRMTELERQLAIERQKHGAAYQLLQGVEFAIRNLETRSQGAALAQQKELDRERQATVRAQRALDEALFELQQHTEARRSATANAQQQTNAAATNQAFAATTKTKCEANSAAPPGLPSPPKKLGRPRLCPIAKPKPVRWWTSSFRAKANS